MLIIPKESIRSTHIDSKGSFSSIGSLSLSDICIQPEDCSKPVLVAIKKGYSDDSIAFSLSGVVVLPLCHNEITLPIKGNVFGVLLSDGSLSVSECRGESKLPDVYLASDIALTNGMLVLSSCSYKAHLQLSGTVKFHSVKDNVTLEGILDAPILYHSDDNGTYCGINTLLKDASILIGNSLKGEHGTIRFGLYSHPEKAGVFSQQFDSDDELLYQFDEPIKLGILNIQGFSDNPMTISPELLAGRAVTSRLLLSLFPAQVTTKYFGNEMILFVHGKQYDEPFTLDISGPWKAYCSNNVFFHLIAPEDPGKLSLCKGNVMLEGILTGNGSNALSLDLTSNTNANIFIFPECKLCRELPFQKIDFHIAENKMVQCTLSLSAPFQLNDQSVVQSPDQRNIIHAQLCEAGFLIKDVLISTESESPESKNIKNSCIIVSGNGRVIVTNE